MFSEVQKFLKEPGSKIPSEYASLYEELTFMLAHIQRHRNELVYLKFLSENCDYYTLEMCCKPASKLSESDDEPDKAKDQVKTQESDKTQMSKEMDTDEAQMETQSRNVGSVDTDEAEEHGIINTVEALPSGSDDAGAQANFEVNPEDTGKWRIPVLFIFIHVCGMDSVINNYSLSSLDPEEVCIICGFGEFGEYDDKELQVE